MSKPATTAAASALPTLARLRPRTVTDQIYDLLYERVVDLTLPPGSRLTEAEVAQQTGVSRQPVRDAFYRLSQLGFLLVRPQRATVVAQISEQAIRQAHFIRLALELACIRAAVLHLGPADHAALDRLIGRQTAAMQAGDHALFHRLDDQFHHDVCAMSGLGFVWALIKENKGHMDRARFLSLGYSTQATISEHGTILAALKARDTDAATDAVQRHLSRIEDTLQRLREEQPEMLGQ